VPQYRRRTGKGALGEAGREKKAGRGGRGKVGGERWAGSGGRGEVAGERRAGRRGESWRRRWGKQERSRARARSKNRAIYCGGESTGLGKPRRHGTAGYVTLHDPLWLSNAGGRIKSDGPTGGRAHPG